MLVISWLKVELLLFLIICSNVTTPLPSSRSFYSTEQLPLIALVLAVFFVWVEFLFLLGYKPDLKKKLDAKIKADIDAWKKSKGKKAN